MGRLDFAEVASIAACLVGFAVPVMTRNPLAYSLTNQILIAVVASYSVFVMLRMNLITFAVPAFMGLGGYAAALAAHAGITDLLVLIPLSFAFPALLAVPLGALVLRLRGIFFVLVTFVLTEIFQLLLFETPSLTGGPNGVSNLPSTSIFGVRLDDNRSTVFLVASIALMSTLIVIAVTRRFAQHFAAIDENEILAESLGLIVWRYKALGFVVSAGLAGMAGFALVNMLLTAHPSSFATLNSVNYLTYAVVGGANSILGPVVGSVLLVWASNSFSTQGEYSQGLFGLLIILVVLFARGGIVGALGGQISRIFVNDVSRNREASLTSRIITVGHADRPTRGRPCSPDLHVHGLSKSYGGLKVFKEINFDLPSGSILGVIGPNGAGKTTLINVISGRVRPTSGVVMLGAQNVTGQQMSTLSRVGLVRSFQHTNIFRSATVGENIARAMRFSGTSLTEADLRDLLTVFDLGGRLEDRSDKLPYGVQKMLGLVMAYVTQPKVLLLDEPAAGLERQERSHVDELVHRAQTDLGCSVLIVEHDMDLVRRLCPRIMVLDSGQTLAEGPTFEVLDNPKVVRAYLGAAEGEE